MHHDIYNPPPPPVPFETPAVRPLVRTRADFVCLATLIAAVALASGLAWLLEPALAILVALGGALVVIESWTTALSFLSRHPNLPERTLGRRIVIILAALVPWLIGLGAAAGLISGLFLLSDALS